MTEATETALTPTEEITKEALSADESKVEEKKLAVQEEKALADPGATQAKVIDKDAGELTLVQKAIRIGIALAIALVSFFPIASVASSPETYASTIETLDEKKTNVGALAASAAAASTAITLLPDNIGDPIANELADLSSDFTIILAALFLEKYLLTLMGMASFRILIPIACVLYIIGVLRPNFRAQATQFTVKLALLAVVLVAVVPISTGIANSIDETFETSQQTDVVVEEEAEPAAQPEEETEGEGFNVFTALGNFFSDGSEAIEKGADEAAQKISSTINYYLEAFAVMLVTSCVVPILVLAGAIWLVGALFGVSTAAPLGAIKSRSWRKPMAEKRKQTLAAVSEVKDALMEGDAVEEKDE